MWWVIPHWLAGGVAAEMLGGQRQVREVVVLVEVVKVPQTTETAWLEPFYHVVPKVEVRDGWQAWEEASVRTGTYWFWQLRLLNRGRKY